MFKCDIDDMKEHIIILNIYVYCVICMYIEFMPCSKKRIVNRHAYSAAPNGKLRKLNVILEEMEEQ